MSVTTALNQIRRTSSRLVKVNILRIWMKDPTFQKILQYAYEPLWTYGLQKVPKVTTCGTLTLQAQAYHAFDMLNALRDRTLTGDAAKDRVSQVLSALTREDQELLTCIIKKDLRAGISVATINMARPGFLEPFGCMLASKYEGQLGKGLYMSLKLDGLRAYFKQDALYTRNGHVIQGVEHIVEQLDPAYEFDGELMVPGKNFQQASGAIRSFSVTRDAVYHVFDMPSIKEPFSERLKAMSKLNTSAHVSLVKHVFVTDEEKINSTFMKAIDQGYEGLVLKTPGHLYQQKRSKDWLKVKMTRDEDLPVIGFFEGEGKYVGMLGGVIVDYNGVAVRVGSGFSDKQRKDIWDNRSHYLVLLAEIHYHEVTPDGSLRHPRFKDWRADKS